MSRPAFRAATDRLIAEGIPLRDVATLFDVTPGTVTRWRSLSPKERLTPPPAWRASLAAFARDAVGSMADRGDNLNALAVKLEAEAVREINANADAPGGPLTFYAATGMLMEHGVTVPVIAEWLGFKPQTVRAMRSGSRNPPPVTEWAKSLAAVAGLHGLPTLARHLEQIAP